MSTKKKIEEDDIAELFPELKKNLEEFEKENMPKLEMLDTGELEKELGIESSLSENSSKEEKEAKKPQKEVEAVKQQLQVELWRQKLSKKHPLDEKIEKLKKELGLI